MLANWLGRKEPLPKELEGLTPEQAAEKIREGAELKAQLETERGRVTELNTKFETFNTEFESKVTAGVEAAVKKLTPARTENNERRELADFLTDPDRAFAERALPITSMVLGTAGVVAKNAARDSMQRKQRSNPGKNFDGYFFEKFENEIDEMAKTVNAAQLANPLTWEHLYFNVKGRHADEIAMQFKEGKLDIGIESGSAGARSGHEAQSDDGKLTPLELKIATKLGQTPEQYAAQKKSLTNDLVGVRL